MAKPRGMKYAFLMSKPESHTQVAELLLGNPGLKAYIGDLATVVRALGSGTFQPQLMAWLNVVIPVDHCVVFTYSEEGEAGHLFTHTQMAPQRAEDLARDYVERFYRQDPNYVTAQDMGDAEFAQLTRRDLQEDYDPAYTNHFFDRNELIDKASSVGRIEDGQVCCNFYRMAGSGTYSDDDLAALDALLPLATALVSSHYALAKARGLVALDNGSDNIINQSIVHTIISKSSPPFDVLTDRERQVCERILLGYTSTGIGLDLDIAPTSVVTYRKRAYEKLGISSQNELFALCLRAMHANAA